MKSYLPILIFPIMLVSCVVASQGDKNAKPPGKQHCLAASIQATAPDAVTGNANNNFMSVKEQLFGSCFAGSKIKDSTALGGFGASDNYPQPIQTHKESVQESGKGLYLLAQPQVATRLGPNPGMRVVLVNRTDELLRFEAADSRIAILQEALDANGQWVAIEQMPRCFCGNSFHRVFLPSNHFWAFSTPRYQGAFKTKLRYSMTLADGSRLHSNAFPGSVHPQQFQAPPAVPPLVPATPTAPPPLQQ